MSTERRDNHNHSDRRENRSGGYNQRRDSRDQRDDRRGRTYDDRPRGDRRDGGYRDDRRGGSYRDGDRRYDDRNRSGYRDDRRDYRERDYDGRRDYRETSDGFEYNEDRDESSRGGWYEERRESRERNRGYSDRGWSDSQGRGGRSDRRDNRYDDRYDDRRHDDRRNDRYDDRRDFRDERRERPYREDDRRDSYDYADFEDDEWDDSWDGDDDFDAPRDERPENAHDRRVEVRCPVAKRCGGCEWLAMPYEEQLENKQEYVEELFNSFKCEVEPIIGMESPWGYRNKVQLPFAPGWPNKEGRTTARWGIFERGSHHIVPCSECLVEDERARPIIATVADLLPRYNIKPYSEKTFDGLLRYCLVRTAHTTGQVMVTLVCNGSRIPSEKAFLSKLLEAHPEITTVVLNINRERTSVILGKEEKVLMGPGYIEDELCGCRFRISSSSFYQTNPIAAEALYNLAIETADLKPSDRIGDAYCGTGTIGIVAAKQSGAKLLGVERNADAVEDARINAQINGIEDAEFIAGDAGSVFARMARAGESLDVVFMDPPRSGSSQAFLANLSRLGPRRVVYISCEPRTQVRDIRALIKNGYRVTRIRPVDMFPHTDHVETVVLLSREKPNDYMRTAARSKDLKTDHEDISDC